MGRVNPVKMCLTCKHYEPYHCTLDDSYIGYLYVQEPTKCRAWKLHDDYKKGGRFYEPVPADGQGQQDAVHRVEME